MDDRRLLGAVEPREVRHRGMQAEEIVESQRLVRALELEGDLLAQALVGRIADRRHGGQPVERAAQDDHDQPGIARAGALAQSAAGRPRRRGAGGAEDSATWRFERGRDEGRHGQRLWNSGER